ncbi:MAG: hypothetical protein SFV52_15110 [Saprospiraceae bacterium]|nr:hypothetical protein [Saprospiraceae bacterium]
MSDHLISLVPHKLEFDNPHEVAQTLTAYLIARKYISATMKNNILSGRYGFEPGEHYREMLVDHDALNQVTRLGLNGVEIISTRTIFHGGGNGIDEVLCPACQQNNLDATWGAVADDWYKGGGNGRLTCIHCEEEALISDYLFRADTDFRWAFSNVGISFYNWPPDFRQEFVAELVKMVGVPIITVYTHI